MLNLPMKSTRRITMEIRVFDSLPDEARKIRTDVFVDEQGFHDEFDETDKSASHLVAFDGNEAVATARIFFDSGRCVIGRIAVIKRLRGTGIGSEIIKAAEREIIKSGNGCAYIHAQQRARGFYEKIGYTAFGEYEPDQGYPHIWMKKDLK